MTGVLLAHADAGQAVGTALGWQIEVGDLRELALQQRHEDLVEGDAEDRGLVGRASGIGAVVDRLRALRDAVDREDREGLLFVVVARMVAERPLEGRVAGGDMALEDDLGVGRHLQVVADAVDEFALAAAQQPGEGVFGQGVGDRRDGREQRRRVAAEDDTDRKRLARMGLLPVAEVERAAAMREPAHDEPVAADELLAVDAEVLAFLVRATRDDEGPRDERGRVAGPAGLDRQPLEIDVVGLDDDVLAGGLLDAARVHVQDLLEDGQLVPGVLEALGGLGFLEIGEQSADLAQCRR